jgi:integrase
MPKTRLVDTSNYYFGHPVYITVFTRSGKKQTTKEEAIYLAIKFGADKKSFKMPTNVRAIPSHISKGIISHRKDDNAYQKNKELAELITKAKQVFKDADAASIIISNDYLRKELASTTIAEHRAANDFLTYINSFIKQAQSRVNPKTGKPLAKRTLYKYEEVRRLLTDYATAHNVALTFDNVATPEFATSWINYLQTEKNYATNTIGTVNNKVKEFVNTAIKQGKTTVQSLQLTNLKTFEEEVDKVYLSKSELKSLWEITELTTYHEKARDLFLIGCWTGLRVSDYSVLIKENIRDNNIYIRMRKTQANLVVPLLPVAKSILEKYDYHLPKMSEQKINKYIKDVAALAEINEPITVSMTKGGKKLSTTKPKYSHISTHTGRRSFATNIYLSGFPLIETMKITGHRSERSFMKYIRVTNEQAADKLREHMAQLAEK